MDSRLVAALRYLERWPQKDRELWMPWITPKIRVHERGEKFTKWKPQTVKDYTIAYTKGLDWLRRSPLLALEVSPESRWTAELLTFLVRDLESGDGFSQAYSDTSIEIILVGIERVLSRIAPAYDRSYLKELAKRYRTTADPTAKLERLAIVSTQKLLECGEQLMARARADITRSVRSAVLYRTGLQIALLALRPLRSADFAALMIGTGIVQLGETFFLKGKSNKSDKSFNVCVPDRLSQPLKEYLSDWRPRINRGRYEGPALWVSSTGKGGAQSMQSIYKQITRNTRDCDIIGVSIYPHLFRDCLATSIAEADPENWDAAHQLLGNTDQTAQKHYEHGGVEQAATLLSRLIDS